MRNDSRVPFADGLPHCLVAATNVPEHRRYRNDAAAGAGFPDAHGLESMLSRVRRQSSPRSRKPSCAGPSTERSYSESASKVVRGGRRR
jgi:hypothetical protein